MKNDWLATSLASMLVGLAATCHANAYALSSRPSVVIDTNNNGSRGPTIDNIYVSYIAQTWRVVKPQWGGQSISPQSRGRATVATLLLLVLKGGRGQ
jgi:hypothetical protein